MKKKIYPIIFWLVLLGYLAILLNTVFFFRIGSQMRSVNLVPFQSIKSYLFVDNGFGTIRLIDMNIWGNILMFVPLGVYLSTLFPKKAWQKLFGLTVLTSLVIEIIQYLASLGSSDIDDIILNSLGGLIGIGCYHLLNKLTHHEEKTAKWVTIISGVIGIPIILLDILLLIAN